MNPASWTIVILAALLGAWLLIDGTRSLALGDYFTPSSGEHAGQLGPWANLLRSVGIDPRSLAVKFAHIAIGFAWLVSAAGFAGKFPWAWWALLTCGVASVWYLPFGTLIAIVELGLLWLPSVRGLFDG